MQRARNRAVLVLGLCLAAPAALADPAMLGLVASGRLSVAPQPAQGYAACLLGGGAIEPVAQILTEVGFSREDDVEMGVTYLSSASAAFSVSLYQDGAICDVSAEGIGTDAAMTALIAVAGMTGFELAQGECTTLRLGATLAELTSTGNDPVCNDTGSSNVRFTSAPAAPNK